MIYAIEAVGLDRVKFGRARNPASRIKELSTGSPVPLRMAGAEQWPDDHEALIHDIFSDFRTCDEWFDIKEIVGDFIHAFSCPNVSFDDRYLSCMKILWGGALPKVRKGGALTNAERVKRYREKRGDAYREENKLRMREKRKNIAANEEEA